ncbi:hypothetical protein LCGC14_0223750 [marine sediment metagenome]|uniref:Uncharacterized protein n=1 Tax=marine sediment metagenome TaxID=412755 RepID=A0A0F9UTJ7_9ZZZZ
MVNSDIHMYYYHIRPPNFDFTSKSIHFIVKFMKNIMDFIHGIESGYRLCCIISYLRGKAKFIRPTHQYFCYKCQDKIKKGIYRHRKRLLKIRKEWKGLGN